VRHPPRRDPKTLTDAPAPLQGVSAAGGDKALALPAVAGVTLRAVLKNARPAADNPHAT